LCDYCPADKVDEWAVIALIFSPGGLYALRLKFANGKFSSHLKYNMKNGKKRLFFIFSLAALRL